MLGAQISIIVMSSSWIDPLIIMQCPSLSLVILILRLILSDLKIATPVFFCFPFVWNIFFHPLTFSLYVSSDLKWASFRQLIYASCFYIHSASLCLLVGAFNIFTVLKGKNLPPRLLYPARISFKIDGEIKSFSDKQKLREFSTTKPALQQMLK